MGHAQGNVLNSFPSVWIHLEFDDKQTVACVIVYLPPGTTVQSVQQRNSDGFACNCIVSGAKF